MKWLRRMFGGTAAPEGFDGVLESEERVLSSAVVGSGGHVVLTPLGLWLPEEGEAGGVAHRRVGWHLVSKATWDGRALTVVEADEVGVDGDAVLIEDRPPVRLHLESPGTVPEIVHTRVTRSVLHSEQASGGGLLVQRRVPGRDGVTVQLRRSR